MTGGSHRDVPPAPRPSSSEPNERGKRTGRLPLVSVVVVNFNYATFLPDAIASVYDQTYPNIECLVVDDASSDASADVLAVEAQRRPDLKVFRKAQNEGQSLACVDGFARTSGAYVVFLDADDVLLPHCIAVHMQVHLTSRSHVGFTSCDAVQMLHGEMILSTLSAPSDYIRGAPPREPALLRPSAVIDGLGVPTNIDIASKVFMVPRRQGAWVWAPTSGNCFRRDALALILDCPGLAELRTQTDLYLAAGINVITGSLLIDEPLFLYRLHGSNVFSSRAQLEGTLSFDIVRNGKTSMLARRLLLDHLAQHIDRFVQDPWQELLVLDAFETLDTQSPGGFLGGRSYAARVMAKNFGRLAPRLGRGALLKFLLLRHAILPAFRCLVASARC